MTGSAVCAFPAIEIERCRLETIIHVKRLTAAVREHSIFPSDWDGWRVFTPDVDAERYETRSREGKCTVCGGTPREGRKLCEICADKQRARAAAFRERRKAAGACVNCGAAVDPPSVRCAACRVADRPRKAKDRAAQAAADKRRYDRRAAAGVCTTCNAPVEHGRRKCAACLDRQRERNRAFRAARKSLLAGE